MRRFQCAEVEQVFECYPERFREPLLGIRELIFETASITRGVGPLEETLKWGQPSYLTKQSKSGSTIRLDRFEHEQIALFFHCQTTLVETFRHRFPDILKFSKNRAIVLNPGDPLPVEELASCVESALTYHL